MRLIMKLVMEEKTDRLVINGNVQVKIRAAKSFFAKFEKEDLSPCY